MYFLLANKICLAPITWNFTDQINYMSYRISQINVGYSHRTKYILSTSEPSIGYINTIVTFPWALNSLACHLLFSRCFLANYWFLQEFTLLIQLSWSKSPMSNKWFVVFTQIIQKKRCVKHVKDALKVLFSFQNFFIINSLCWQNWKRINTRRNSLQKGDL